MITATFAQYYLWVKLGNLINNEIADWQIYRIYTLLGKGNESPHFAKKCLEIEESNHIGDFDLPFAYEAMAWAYALQVDMGNYSKYYNLGIMTLDGVKDQDNRDCALS